MIISSQMKIEGLTKEQLTELTNTLSDLLCWWQGFKLGVEVGNEFVPEALSIANHSIDQVREINFAIKKAALESSAV